MTRDDALAAPQVVQLFAFGCTLDPIVHLHGDVTDTNGAPLATFDYTVMYPPIEIAGADLTFNGTKGGVYTNAHLYDVPAS